ncbi:vacuolar protein sorting-associated protein 13A, partial [Trifolium medium]|nr:vacuolar protein sorting-associated protein 13A [Trifolium medium]
MFQFLMLTCSFKHMQAGTTLAMLMKDAFSPTYGGNSIMDAIHKRNYYIIPQNKLGQDIFIRATEARGLQNIIKMPSGDMKAVKVPVSKDMLESHLRGKLCRKIRTMVTIIIAEAQ